MVISKNNNATQYALSVASLILAAAFLLAWLPCVEGQPGICPDYYGPFEPNPIGQSESCQNMMHPGSYLINWAHGAESEWDWQGWNQVNMEADTKYVITYNSIGELSIDKSHDSSLTGYALICCKNQGPDELVLCLEPV
jgi:hypothetical protein